MEDVRNVAQLVRLVIRLLKIAQLVLALLRIRNYLNALVKQVSS